MDKTSLVTQIIAELNGALEHALAAADEAHKGATHEQSKAETQYDTLGLEHAYLAEGQARRIQELKDSITQLHHFKPKAFNQEDAIYLGALLKLEGVDGTGAKPGLWVLLAPTAGGMNLDWQQRQVQIISPNSPMTKALLGLYLDDEFTLANGLRYQITELY
ncbi:MAG: transcription elongation GreA/GreB family factor [Bermanella sp.]|jgi:transcription elongation GreA/GreB family factor